MERTQTSVLTITIYGAALNIGAVCSGKLSILCILQYAWIDGYFCGDFNAKHLSWGLRLASPKDRELCKSVCTNKCVIVCNDI